MSMAVHAVKRVPNAMAIVCASSAAATATVKQKVGENIIYLSKHVGVKSNNIQHGPRVNLKRKTLFDKNG